MRFIPTRVHGILDYTVGAFLSAMPWLFGFERGGAETWVPVFLGAAAIVYSVFTRYEFGVVRRIPMRTHLSIDLASGVVLAASPWVFGFFDYVWIPHFILGLFEISAALMTQTIPSGMSSGRDDAAAPRGPDYPGVLKEEKRYET